MVLPYRLHQKLNQRQKQQQETISSNSSCDYSLLQKPFWIWDKEENLRLERDTDGQCCWNHVVGLPVKDKKEYPLFDYEKILFDSLLTQEGTFKDKHLWVLKSTGLGITEFFLRTMAWLCTCSDNSVISSNGNGQMCIVTGPNIDRAIKLIRCLKNIFESKLGIIFQNKETLLELNGCQIEAYPSNHID